jgi:CBS domain-containing protein
MKAREIMRWNPAVVTPDEAVSHVAEHMRYEHDACIPVVNNLTSRALVGIITARDLATRCMARCHGAGCTVGDHMTPMPLHTAHLDDDLAALLLVMHGSEIRRLPVVSENDVLIGIITEHAVIEALASQEAHKRISAMMMSGLVRTHAKPS